MIDQVDTNGSGNISFDEFVTMIVLRMENAMMSDPQQVTTTMLATSKAIFTFVCL